MRIKIQIGVAIVSALVTAVSLVWSFSSKAPWSLIALIFFIIFVFIVAWGWYEAAQRATDILLQKDQQKHLKRIRVLIEELNNSLMTPSKVYFGMPLTPTQQVEGELLFDSLKKHIQAQSFWKDYSNWKNTVKTYKEQCQEILEFIKQEQQNLNPGQMLKEWGTQVMMVQGITWTSPYDSMMIKYKNSLATNSKVQSLFEELDAMEKKLHQHLLELLESHDYRHPCRLCPMK